MSPGLANEFDLLRSYPTTEQPDVLVPATSAKPGYYASLSESVHTFWVRIHPR